MNFELAPPWSDGLRVFARGLIESIRRANGDNVEIRKLDGEIKNDYDFVHVISGSPMLISKVAKNLKNCVVFKHIITPPLGLTTALKTKIFYSIMSGFGGKIVKCFSSDFVAQSYFMQGDFVIPPSINTTDFTETLREPRRLCAVLENSKAQFGMTNMSNFEDDLVLYSGPLSIDRFPYVQVLNGIKETKSEILIIGRNTTNNDIDSMDNIISYARKIGIENKIAIAVKVLTEEQKILLINSASVVIQPFDKKIRKVAVDPPIFLLESMACCRPVITSGAYSLETIIRNGYNGYIVDWSDPIQFSDALQNSLDNSKIGVNARTTILDNFSVESVSGKLRGMYNEFS